VTVVRRRERRPGRCRDASPVGGPAPGRRPSGRRVPLGGAGRRRTRPV